MSPLDDELRAALRGRADVLTASPDPLAGIEARAGGLRRRRTAASLAGAVLAVSGIALAVPALQPGKAPSRLSTDGPTSALPANALRQGSGQEGTTHAELTSVVSSWASKHPGAGRVYSVTLVNADVGGEPTLDYALLEIWRANGPAYGVVAQDSKGATPVLVRDEVLPAHSAFLDGVVSGNGVGPFVVYALDLDVKTIAYDPGTGVIGKPTTFQTGADQSNAGLYPRGDLTRSPDRLQATYDDGRTVTEDVWTGASDGRDSELTNLLAWPTRGSQDSSLLAAARSALAPSLSASTDQVLMHVLFTGQKNGVRYVVGQAYKRGDSKAHGFAYAEGGTNGPQVFFGPVTSPSAQVMAFLIDSLPGATADLLVVVPAPRTTQVSYGVDGNHEKPVADTPGTDGVALVDRSRTPGADVLTLLTGNGGPTDVTFHGPVAALLCGDKECG